MVTNVISRLCLLFSLLLYAAAAPKTLATPLRKRFNVYLTGQHNIVPELPLVSRITHVTLAFMQSEVFNNPNQDEWPLFTSVDEVRPKFADGTQIQVAIGGWGNTKGFSEAAKTKQSRKLFAENVKAMIDATGADGVDIDWEYPGGNGEDYKQHPNSEKAWEIEAYPELLAEIRAAIGPSKILSAAVPGLYRDCIAFTWTTVPKIFESIDFLNVMSYDLMNRRDEVTKHHSGLGGAVDALRIYTDPAIYVRYLNVGLGFYIKWFRTAGADLGKAGAFSWHDEVPPELAESFAKAMKYGVDDMTGGLFIGHYYMDKEERIFWSWDAPDSISKKLGKLFEFFNEHDGFKNHNVLGGVFAWGLGEDAPDFKHLKAVNEALRKWDESQYEHEEL